jgi:hypothetical protein
MAMWRYFERELILWLKRRYFAAYYGGEWVEPKPQLRKIIKSSCHLGFAGLSYVITQHKILDLVARVEKGAKRHAEAAHLHDQKEQKRDEGYTPYGWTL